MCHSYNYEIEYQNKVLVTIHRKENLGSKLIHLFREIEQLAITNPDIEFIFPMHPNPEIQKHKHIFNKVNIVPPKQYDEMLKLLSIVKFVISDSGGLQEECAFFKKKILVCRKITERPEGVGIGLARIVNTDISKHFDWANQKPEWHGDNPYGNGQAHKLIVDDILNFLDLSHKLSPSRSTTKSITSSCFFFLKLRVPCLIIQLVTLYSSSAHSRSNCIVKG